LTERHVATCNGPNCGAEIVWAKTSKGKNMCLDAEPSPEGEWVLEGEDEPKPRCVKMAGDTAATYTGPKYTAHWGNCPDRESFRRKRR
jgi:hypothetical protein